MNYQNISGLDLFQTPFHRTQAVSTQASGQQANRQKPNDTNSQPKPVASTAQIVNAKPQAEPAPKQDARGKSDTQPKAGRPEPKAPDVQPKAAVAGQGAHATQPKPFEIQPKTPVSGDVTAQKPSPVQEQAAASAVPQAHVDTQKQPVPKKELVLDMSAGTTACSPLKASDQEKRNAHEAAEAKRKAELQKLQNMTDEEAVAVATKRISEDVERITRRNMKEYVASHIQDLCRKDPVFARLTMHPRKSMVNCFKYINRQAKEYVKQEMENNGIKPENCGYGYCCDIPDGIIYQFALDYFATDAPEDQEKFVPKPYVDANPKPKKAASNAKKAEKPDKKKSKDKQETDDNSYEQMTLGV